MNTLGTGAAYRPDRLAATALLITATADILFYVFLAAEGYPEFPGVAAYRDLQRAATVADGWFGITALAAGLGLLTGKRWAPLAGIVAAAALVHMGFLDVAFHLDHGMYDTIDGRMAEMIVVDLWAFAAGTWMILRLGRPLLGGKRLDGNDC